MLSHILSFIKDYPVILSTLSAGLFALIALLNNIRMNRTKNSLEFESKYKHNEKIVEATIQIKKILRSTTPVANWGKEEHCFTVEALALSTVMNEWERCANAIYHKVYDNDFLYGTYGSTVIYLFTNLKPYIDKRQDHNKRVYAKFCWLAIRWKIQRDSEESNKADKHLKEAKKQLDLYLK